MKWMSLAVSAMITVGALPVAANPIVIADVTVIDVDKGEALPGRTVTVEGDRIVSVEAAPPRAAAGATVIDGRGKFLIPGLVDMHVHFAPVPGAPGDAAARAASVMLAHGVTTARSMAGNPAHIALRDAVERGALLGPRIYAASPALAENKIKAVDDARAAIRAAKEAGFDFVKMHQLPDSAVWQAAQDEARALGLATAGHVTNPVGLARAFAARQQVEHLDGFPHALTDSGDADFGQIPPPEVVAAIDLAKLPEHPVFAQAAEAGSYQVPTLSLFEKLLATDVPTEELAARSEMRFVPPASVRQWSEQRAGLIGQISPTEGAKVIVLRRAIVAALAAKGVPIMAGSDTAQAFHVWGPALHQEMRALAAVVGAPTALRAATSTPADYFASLPGNGSALGWKADFGRVASGLRADLVLLDANPLADISAIGRPSALVLRGKLLGRATLDALLAEAERQAQAVP